MLASEKWSHRSWRSPARAARGRSTSRSPSRSSERSRAATCARATASRASPSSCALHSVSRATASKALEWLERAGVVRREQGRGTFVEAAAAPAAHRRARELQRVDRAAPARAEPAAAGLRRVGAAGTGSLAIYFEDDDPLVRIERRAGSSTTSRSGCTRISCRRAWPTRPGSTRALRRAGRVALRTARRGGDACRTRAGEHLRAIAARTGRRGASGRAGRGAADARGARIVRRAREAAGGSGRPIPRGEVRLQRRAGAGGRTRGRGRAGAVDLGGTP